MILNELNPLPLYTACIMMDQLTSLIESISEGLIVCESAFHLRILLIAVLHQLLPSAVGHVQVINACKLDRLQRVQCLVVVSQLFAPLNLRIETHVAKEQLRVH